MAANLLRKLTRSAFTFFPAIDLISSSCCGGYAASKKIVAVESDLAQKLSHRCSLLAADRRPACACRKSCNSVKKKKKVPKGYVPVLIVGEDDGGVSGGCKCGYRQVYVVRVCVLGHPLLADLLERSCQQFGYSKYAGALRLPCDPQSFESLLSKLHEPLTVHMRSFYTTLSPLW